MTTISSHPITVNGVDLQNYCYNITTRTGWANLAGFRGSNPKASGRDGAVFDQYKTRDTGRLVLSMWVSAYGPDGTPPAFDPLVAWRHNMDALASLFDSQYGKLDVRIQWNSATGDLRRAYCDVEGALNPAISGQDPYSPLTVELTVLDCWESIPGWTYQSPNGSATTLTTHTLSSTIGMTARIKDPVIWVRGPVANPSLVDNRTQQRISLNRVLTADERWEIDTGAFSSRIQPLVTGSLGMGTIAAGSTPNVMSLTTMISPDASMFAIAPAALITNPSTVTLSGTGGGAETALLIQGARKFRA